MGHEHTQGTDLGMTLLYAWEVFLDALSLISSPYHYLGFGRQFLKLRDYDNGLRRLLSSIKIKFAGWSFLL